MFYEVIRSRRCQVYTTTKTVDAAFWETTSFPIGNEDAIIRQFWLVRIGVFNFAGLPTSLRWKRVLGVTVRKSAEEPFPKSAIAFFDQSTTVPFGFQFLIGDPLFDLGHLLEPPVGLTRLILKQQSCPTLTVL